MGQTLTANTASLGGSGTVSFQWQRGTTNIGTNSSTYVVQTADVGSMVTVTVTRAGNSGSVVSVATVPVVVTVPAPDPTRFAWVEGGMFLMGIMPMRNVTLSPFYMSRFQLTQGEWYDVMGTRPSFFIGTNNDAGSTVMPTFNWRDLPVEQVSWYVHECGRDRSRGCVLGVWPRGS